MFDFLESGIELDASGYREGADEAVDAALDVGGATDDASQSLIDIDKRGVAAGGALAGLGTAMQATLDDTQELRESLGRTAASTDLTSDEANGLARSLTDASFPIEDATATMDALAQQGVETEAEMERLALASDDLADATGTSAESIASDLGPAVRGLDGDLDAIEDNADTFTTVIRNTTLEADDLGRTLERSSTELQEMGVASDEAAQLVGAYAEETGKSGRQAQRDFSSAVREADGDIEELKDELGLTEEQVEAFSGELEENQGATEDHARAANESLSTMDELRAGFDRTRLAVGDYLGPVSAAAPALQGLGVAAIAMSTINTGALAPSFMAVSAASLPVSAPLLAIGAGLGVIGGAVAALAWRSDWIDPMETAGWAAERAGDGLGWLRDRLLDGADAVNRFYPPIRVAREVWDRNLFGIQDRTEAAVGVIGDAIDWLVEKVNVIPGVNIGGDEIGVDEDAAEEAGEDVAAGVQRGAGSGPALDAGSSSGESLGPGTGTAEETPSIDRPDDPPPTAATQDETSRSSGSAAGSGEVDLSRETIRDLSDALVERVEGTALEVLLEIDDRELDRLIEDRVDAALTN